MIKNTANQKIAAQLVSSTDGSDVTTGTTTVYVTIDAGTQSSIGTATHEGNGCWSIDTGVAGNTNGDHLAFTFVNSSAVSVTVNVYTINALQTGDSFARLGAPTGASVSADIADVPTVSEFNARTLAAADYFDPTADTVANVTTVATLTGHTAQTGDTYAALPTNFSDLSITVTTGRVDVASVEGSDATDQIRDAVVDDATRIDASALNTLSGFAPASTIAAATDVPSAAANADAVWDEAASGHVGAGSFGVQCGTDIDAILADTNELQTDWANGGRLDLLVDQIITDIAALNNISTADVNAQVLDVMNTDTFGEPTGVPGATATLVAKLGWLAALARNKVTQTATTTTLRNDADGANIATATVSDDGSTFTRNEWT